MKRSKCKKNMPLFKTRASSSPSAHYKKMAAIPNVQAKAARLKSRPTTLAAPFLRGSPATKSQVRQHSQENSNEESAAAAVDAQRTGGALLLLVVTVAILAVAAVAALTASIGLVASGDVGVVVLHPLNFEVLDLGAGGGVHRVGRLEVVDGDELAGVGALDAVLDHVLDALGDRKKGEVLAEPVVVDEAALALAGLHAGGLGVGSLKARKVELVVLLLEVLEVDAERDGAVIVDVDETIVGLLLRVLIDETSTKGRHLLAIQGLDFVENAGLNLVTTIFREEDAES